MTPVNAFIFLVAALVALTSAQAADAPKELEIARNGQSKYSICLSRDASPSEQRAAAELQQFLREMSGATLPIVTDNQNPAGPLILIGRSSVADRLATVPYEQLGPEGFALKTTGEHLIIAGGRQRGTMYGVYGLLDKLGCRWFAKGVNRIPKRPKLVIPRLDETQKPAFEYRETFFTEAWDKDWSARNRVNGQSHHLDASTGGKVQYYPFVHSFLELIPPEKYFKTHPEYFSLIDGKRREEKSQLCLTNPDVLRLGIESVERWIREHPEATIFSVSQNDWTGWCECDNCRRVEEQEGGVHSGPLLHYVNKLAAEIEKKHPDKLIDTLAYWYTERPPRHVRPRRNVRIRLCPIGACEAHPYEQCPYNRFFVDILKSWSQMTDRLYIWHYNTNFSHYLIPYPDFDELAADIPMYKRHGVVGLFLQGAYAQGGGGENAELRSYMMARLLWNPAANAEQEINDFHAAYYGKAAKPMRAYFDLLHRQVRFAPRGKGNHFWIFVNPRLPYLSPEFLKQANELFRKADQKAESPAIRQRIAKARLSLDYVELARAKQFDLRDGTYGPRDADRLKTRFATFVEKAKGFGIQYFSESGSVDTHAKAFEKRIRPYRAYTLENSAVRVSVVPELGGRIIEIVDKTTGVNVLRVPDSGSFGYPDLSGASVSVHSGYYGKAYELQWRPEAEKVGSALVMTGSLPWMTVRRRISLTEAGVATQTEVDHRGDSAVPVAIQVRADYSPRDELDGQQLAWRYQPVSGSLVDRLLFQPGQETSSNETLTGDARPAGEWTAYHKSDVPALVNRFQRGQVGRCLMQWSLRGASVVTLGLWSPEVTLAPGQKLKLEAEYAIGRQAR